MLDPSLRENMPEPNLFNELKGYSLASEVIHLQQKRYDIGMAKVDAHTQQIELWTEQQRHINALYSKLLNAKKTNAAVIDFSSPEDSVMVDKVSEIVPALFTPGEYTWSKDHVNHLTDGLNAHVKTIETSMGIRMTFCNHDMQELTELFKEFHDMNKRESDHTAHIIHNR